MTTVEDVLAHHGVKGMKWGARRAAKKADKADAKWQKNIYSARGAINVHNSTADKINKDLPALNAKYKDVNLHKHMNLSGEGTTPRAKQYLHEYNQLVAHHTAAAVKEVHGTSPSGKYKASLDTSNKDQWKVKVTPVMQHGIEGMDSLKPSPMSSPTAPELLMDVNNHPETGHITSHKKIKTPVEHSIEEVFDEIISHHGVKGMHWGSRKGAKSSVISRDAQKAHTIRRKAEKNTTKVKALTNSEIKQYANRVDLESKYNNLTKKKSKLDAGHKHVKKALEIGGTATALYAFAKSPVGKMVRESLVKNPAGKHFAK